MRQESDGVRLYTAETTFTWWRKAFMHVETSQDGVERSWWTSSNSAQLFCETSITASRDTILTCRDVHKIALSHQVKVVKANYTKALRLTPAPYVVLCAFENFMVISSKSTVCSDHNSRRPGNAAREGSYSDCHWCKKGHFVVVLRRQNFRPVPIAFFLLKN